MKPYSAKISHCTHTSFIFVDTICIPDLRQAKRFKFGFHINRFGIGNIADLNPVHLLCIVSVQALVFSVSAVF